MVMSAGFEAAWVGFTLAAGDSVSEQASCWGGQRLVQPVTSAFEEKKKGHVSPHPS